MDKREFSERVIAMEGRLHRIGYGMLKNTQDMTDAVQEAVLKAWQRLGGLKNEKYFETWLTRILINECYDALESRKRFLPLDSAPEPTAPPEGAHADLHDALMALDCETRLPIILSYMEGYRQREIAKMLNLPLGTVKSRIMRGKAELRRLLENSEVDIDD